MDEARATPDLPTEFHGQGPYGGGDQIRRRPDLSGTSLDFLKPSLPRPQKWRRRFSFVSGHTQYPTAPRRLKCPLPGPKWGRYTGSL